MKMRVRTWMWSNYKNFDQTRDNDDDTWTVTLEDSLQANVMSKECFSRFNIMIIPLLHRY
jgi:hypothetical protein